MGTCRVTTKVTDKKTGNVIYESVGFFSAFNSELTVESEIADIKPEPKKLYAYLETPTSNGKIILSTCDNYDEEFYERAPEYDIEYKDN